MLVKRLLVLLFLALVAFSLGCSGGQGEPVIPVDEPVQVSQSVGKTACMGYWQVAVEVDTGEVSITRSRASDLILNVLGFLEPPAMTGLSIDFGTLVLSPPQLEVDVILTHPIPDPVFTGFDVRGIVFGPDVLNADGFTRLMMPQDFTGVPFGYKDGLLGVPNSTAHYSGAIAGYKYFCDNLGADEDLDVFFSDEDNLADRGQFTSNSSNRRHYVLSWEGKTSPIGFLVFNYAVYANYDWPVGEPPVTLDSFDITNANSHEAFCVRVDEVENTLYYYEGVGGGTITLGIEVWDWQGFDDYDVTIIANPDLGPDAIHYDADSPGTTSKSHIFSFTDITGTMQSAGDVEVTITAFDKTATFGSSWFLGLLPPSHKVYNDAVFTAWKYYVTIAENAPPIINSGVDGNAEPFEMATEQYSVDADDPQGDSLTYEWTLTDVKTGNPVSGFDGVPGNGDGTIDIDFSLWPYAWALAGTEFELDCDVSDSYSALVAADTLEIKVGVDGDIWVSNHPDFAAVADNGTKAEPYSTPAQAFAAIPSNPSATIVIDYGTGTYDLTAALSHSGATYNNVTWRGYSWYTTPGGRPSLRKMHSSTYAFYISGATNFTAQGLKFEFSQSYSGADIFYLTGSSQNPTIRDCVFTGTNGYYTCQAVDEWSCPGFTFTHNKVTGMGTGPYASLTTRYIYAVRMTNSISGNRTVTYNEFTNLAPSSFTLPYYSQLQVIGLRTPGGNCQITNNLIHHITPAWASGYCEQVGYVFMNNTGNSGTYNFSNNTVDQLDFSGGTDSGYGLYAYYNYYTGQAPASRNDIVSTYHGTPSMIMYGFYHYYNGVNGVTYCNAYAVDDTAYSGFTTMTGNIQVDPQYENNTTAPYDYHLKTGSPCKGTGYSGQDMGCYGNMASGETIVGLVTPE